MKKIIFGSAAALLAVVGLSSFKTAPRTNFYWFYTNAITGDPTTYDRFAATNTLGCTSTVLAVYCENSYTRGQLSPATGTPTAVLKTVNGIHFQTPITVTKKAN